MKNCNEVIEIKDNDSIMKIYMLGDFTITCGKIELTEKDSRASKIWRLIQYLILQRHRFVSHNELIDVLCSDEDIRNPANTLRTMIYRARALLAKGGFDTPEEMILSKSGGYNWNNKVHYIVDVEELEAAYEEANNCTEKSAQLDALLKVTEIYRGDFLPESAGERWVLPYGRKYRSLYISCVHKALKLLIESGRLSEAEELCSRALRIDPFDEKILEYRLRSLIALGKNTEAYDEYRSMETMFYEIMGVRFSEDLRKLHNQIIRPAVNEELSLEEMLEDWLKGVDFPGAFYCDLSVFRAVYQIESRNAYRLSNAYKSAKSTFIVRIDTKQEVGERRVGVMKQLGMVIPASLRRGDLFTRASPNQYLLMFKNLSYENCKMLVDRILRSLDAKRLSKISEISIKPLIPIG